MTQRGSLIPRCPLCRSALATITLGLYPIATCTSCNARWIQDGHQQRVINQIQEPSLMAGRGLAELDSDRQRSQPMVLRGSSTEPADMTPVGSRTATAAPPTGPSTSSELRLRFDSGLSGAGIVNGGWWPHSWDPDTELPELIASLQSSFGPITRVALNLDAWDRAPRRIAVDGRHVRVGWFQTMDGHMIGVTRALQDRLALLVVPPEATTAAAQIAMAMAADPTNSTGPADILATAGIAFAGAAPT
jgi:hypothetical protein